MTLRAVLAVLTAAVAAPLAAQSALPDPASVALPDVALPTDPAARAKVLEDGYKFFYFHSSSVSFAEAWADLAECRAHLASGAPAMLPGFVPFGETVRRDLAYQPSPYGLVGEAMVAIIAPKMERGLRNNKLRRCMGTRGYARYAVAEPAWDQLNEGDEDKLLAMQARLASGPKPDAPEVTR